MAAERLNQSPPGASSSKRWLPLVLMVGLLTLAMHFFDPSNPPPVKCATDVAEESATVVMLSTSWCQYCRRARSYFVDHGVRYCEWDIEQTKRGAELHRQSRLKGVPIIYVGDEVVVGFNRNQIAQLLKK